MVASDRKILLTGMQLLFIIAIAAIPLTFMVADWGKIIVILGELVGVALLLKAVPSKKYKVSLTFFIIDAVVSVVLLRFAGALSASFPAQIGTASISAVLTIVSMGCLYDGTADVMEQENCPEEAESGRFAWKLTLVAGIFAVVVTIVEWLEKNGSPNVETFAYMGEIVLGLVSTVMTVALFVIRLTYFRRCHKKLLEKNAA